jgi:hypothetical protein
MEEGAWLPGVRYKNKLAKHDFPYFASTGSATGLYEEDVSLPVTYKKLNKNLLKISAFWKFGGGRRGYCLMKKGAATRAAPTGLITKCGLLEAFEQ